MHYFYFVCILCVGFMSITSFRLPLVTQYSYRESTPVELLYLEHPPSYRQRRSDDCSPDHIDVRFTADNNEVKLSLQRNYDISVNAPLYVNINGTITHETHEHLENVAVYQDLENGSAILVQCFPSTRKFELFGTFYNGSEELMIEPELNEGQEEFSAAGLDDVQSRDAKRKKEQVSQDQDLRESFTISHHVIYKGKTTRPKESDFILKVGLLSNYRAGTDHSARVKRADPATTEYQVELLMVADYSAYSFWLTKSSSSAAAKVLLRQFYAFVLNGIDLRFKSLTGSGFTITVLFAGLYIAETPSDALWTESRKFLSGSAYHVNGEAALGNFKTWIQNSSSLPGHDHAMLFTAYDLELNNSNAGAGLTYLGGACTTFSVSVIEDNFDAKLITIAAHELAHSLGAWHDGTLDGTGNNCSPTLAYIMSASVTLSNLGTSGFQYNKNLWKFSLCSISYFRTYLNTLNSTNCLTILNVGYNSTALSPYDQHHPGQVYSADTQCQYIQGNDSYLCRSIYDGNYTNLCTSFYCHISGSGSCSLSIAAERTTCGDRKWCLAGECITATEAPSSKDTCPFENQPGIVANGQTCAQLVANSSFNCYNYAGSCCESCQNVYTGIIGCEYGDIAVGCIAGYCVIYDKTSLQYCCKTCNVPLTNATSAPTSTKTTFPSTIATASTMTTAPNATTISPTTATTTTTAENKCPPGTFYSLGSICFVCNVGTYQPNSGQTTCMRCPIGTYQPNIASTKCSQCNPGSYQNATGSTACVLCMAGTYQSDAGKPECIACPGGTYQWQNGSQSCLKCNPGSYQNRIGGSTCIPCPEGYYNPITGTEACRPCQIGTFQNSTGQTFCFLCPKDYTTEQEGERSQRACFQGICPEYTNISMSTISITLPPTRIGQTGYSWNRCKNDSSKALVSAFCQNISRTEVIWTDVKMLNECNPEQLGPTSPISAQLLNISKMDVNENNLHNVLQETNKIIQLQENLTSVDFQYVSDILGKVNMVDNISKEVLNATLDTVNMLIAFSSATNIAQKSPGYANRILQIVEDITNKVQVGMSENPVRLIKPNIASSVWEQVGDRLIGIQLLHSNENFIRNDSVTHLQHEPEYTELLDAAIFFQSDVLNATTNKIGMTVLWNDALFKTGSERYKVVSKIMAAKLQQNGVSITHLGKHYVRRVFLSSDDDSRVVCGYWDYRLNQNGGGWTIDGCNHTIDKKRHICTCNHLTNFAILVDLEAKLIPPEHEQALEFITYIGLILSIIGISLTILTFLCFRHLRRGRGQQTLFCLCIPMLCYSIIFLVGIKQTEHYVPCIIVSALIHYFILAAFMWMLMEGIVQYLRFVKVLGTYIPNFLIKISIPAWVLPLVPVIALLAYDYNLYYGGKGFCWMKLEALYYAFVIPICLIILANAIIFIMVISQICRRPKGIRINQSEWKLTILCFQSAISIFVILGLTWIFGVVALGGAKLVFQYIFVILNAFQGFFIFLLFTAREKQVRDQWARFCCKKPTGHFTSLEQNSSSRGTFSTAVSGSSMADNKERQLSSSSRGSRSESSL